MGHMGIVKLLLDNGANPNCANERGETALHLAARGDQTEAMEMLLDNGALVDAKAKVSIVFHCIVLYSKIYIAPLTVIPNQSIT